MSFLFLCLFFSSSATLDKISILFIICWLYLWSFQKLKSISNFHKYLFICSFHLIHIWKICWRWYTSADDDSSRCFIFISKNLSYQEFYTFCKSSWLRFVTYIDISVLKTNIVEIIWNISGMLLFLILDQHETYQN